VGKKKSPPQYIEAIDFLIGSNPIEGILQGWLNADRYPLNFTSQVFAGHNPGGASSVTITDAEFYFVIAVTYGFHFVGTFSDYGGPIAVPYDVTCELPLWNAVQHGPDLLSAGASKYYPWVYKWAPSDGNVVTLPFTPLAGPPWLGTYTGNCTVYYAQLSAAIKHHSPSNRMCLTFEPVLGDGAEYSDAGLSSQQILYPEYAGAGSPDFDLGTAGVIPSTSLEIKGSFARFHPRGDADFCDMIEDIIKSGMLQVGSQLGLIQRGVNLNGLPGPIQTGRISGNFGSALTPLTYYQPSAAGNQLVAIGNYLSGGPSATTISDTAGNSWTPIIVPANNRSVWTATSVGSAANNVVTLNNLSGGIRAAYILEMDQGSTVLDNYSVFSGSAGTQIRGSLVVSGASTYVLAVLFADDSFTSPPQWTEVFPRDQNDSIWSQIVAKPGTVTFKIPVYGGGANWTLVLIAYKAAQPVPYPAALGNIVDQDSLELVRNQCWAAGLIGSLVMDSQKTAIDWLKEIYQCADAAPVWSGFVLKSIPRSEVSAAGNGRIYIAPTAPVFNLTESDMIGDPKNPLWTIERKAQVDTNNILQVQYFDRNSDYNQSLAAEPLAGAIALYGPRKEDPVTLPEIQDPLVARKILSVEVRRRTLLRNVYKGTAMAKWAPLEAMDVGTINESKLGLSKFPVRIVSVKENDKYELEIEAEPFFYGCNAPDVLTVTAAAPYQPSTGGDPGQVNTPIIFEPVPRLMAQQNQAQIWCVVSGSSANYGGCYVLLSTDGGNSYNPVGMINGNAVTGITTADWPIAADPDTANNLPVDLTESLGSLLSYQTSDRDNFTYPCYVAGGTACIPYELMTYNLAVLTATNKYTLTATGTGNELRRAVFGAPQVGTGVDHPNGSRFAFLNPAGIGIFKINMDPLWAGKTLHFKFLAFNTFVNNEVAQSDATDYTYTPNGCPAANQNPNNSIYQIIGGALTQPTPTTLAMAQATAVSPSGSVNYNARNAGNTASFTIPAPTVPTTYYVTIADPGFLGDIGSAITRLATASTSNALVGVAGNVFIGSIVALPAGGSTITSPGGTPGITTSGLALMSDVQNEKYVYAEDTGAANAYVATLVPVPPAYTEGMGVVLEVANANSGASTLNLTGPSGLLGAKAIKKITGSGLADLASGDFSVGQIVYLKYDGTVFQVISQLPTSGGGTPFGETLSVGTSSIATLSHTPNPASFLQLTRNGVVQQVGIGNDFTLSGTTITLAVAGLVTDIFQAFYIY
jgi:hypothetical protein